MTKRSKQPLLPMKPYDDSSHEFITLYDNMPYEWDSDYEKHLTLVSGNIIKDYRCRTKEPYTIQH